MKNIFKIGFIALSGFVFVSTHATASLQTDQLAAGNYVVIATFREGQSELAQKFTDNVNQKGLHASFGLDASRKQIYVYLSQYSDLSEALREMVKARQEGGFPNAWVRVLGGSTAVVVAKPVEKPLEKKTEEKPVATVYVAIPKSAVDAPAGQTATSETVSTDEAVVVENPKAEPVYLPQTLANTPIFMSMYNPNNGKMIDGEIEIRDTERDRFMTKVKGNTYLKLPDPKSKSGQLTLVCNAFGYKKVKHEMNFKSTESDTLRPYVDLVGNFYLVKFDLQRYGKGDMSSMDGVDFYNESAIMRPESMGELTGLLQMMQENERYKIMIHGHTNGNSRGPMITMGPSKNFFSLTKDVVRGTGSSKELSEARAQVVKDWLIAQGVAADRIQVKGWGGDKMIHDKESVNAGQNVRVEVEITAE